MYDAYAEHALPRAIVDEIGEPGLGFGHGHAVKVDFGLHTETAAGEFSHRALANMLAVKAHAVRIVTLYRVDISLEALAQRLLLIGSSEARFRGWLLFCFGYTLFGT